MCFNSQDDTRGWEHSSIVEQEADLHMAWGGGQGTPNFTSKLAQSILMLVLTQNLDDASLLKYIQLTNLFDMKPNVYHFNFKKHTAIKQKQNFERESNKTAKFWVKITRFKYPMLHPNTSLLGGVFFERRNKNYSWNCTLYMY